MRHITAVKCNLTALFIFPTTPSPLKLFFILHSKLYFPPPAPVFFSGSSKPLNQQCAEGERNATSYHFSFPSELHGEGLFHRPEAALEHSPSPARKGTMSSNIIRSAILCELSSSSARTHTLSVRHGSLEPQAAPLAPSLWLCSPPPLRE